MRTTPIRQNYSEIFNGLFHQSCSQSMSFTEKVLLNILTFTELNHETKVLNMATADHGIVKPNSEVV